MGGMSWSARGAAVVVAGLLAGTAAATHALQGLLKDDEGEVRRTVQAILERA